MPRKYCAYVLHHGTTTFNEKGLYTGWIDVPLDSKGERDARAAKRFLAGRRIDCVATSPLCRAVRTAEIVTEGHDVDIEECHSLFPWSIPEFWGMPKDEYTKGLKPYVDDPKKRPKWGETLTEFRKRIGDFFEDNLDSECVTLFVTHTSDIIALSDVLNGTESNEMVVGPGGLLGVYEDEDGDGWCLEVLMGEEIAPDYGQ